jgi:peroxiredoxin
MGLVGLLMALASPAGAQSLGQGAPAFSLPDLTGKVHQVNAARDRRGKLIVFFTSW